MEKKCITILINSYEPTENDLLNSVNSCLNQIDINVKLIIVTIENDKTFSIINFNYKKEILDKTIQIIQILKYNHPGKGPRGIYYQLNEGLKHIKTKFFSYFSSNDIMYPTKCKNEINKLLENDAIFCFSSFNSIIGNQKIKYVYNNEMNYSNLLKGCYINDCATINLSKLDNDLFFNYEKYENTCYWNLWLDILEKYGEKSMVYNNNIEWDYIKIESKSQSMQRKKNKQLADKYHNIKEYMLSNHDIKIKPHDIFNYKYEKVWWWNNQINKNKIELTIVISLFNTNKEQLLSMLESLKNQKNVNFAWELLCFGKNKLLQNVIESYIEKLQECKHIFLKIIENDLINNPINPKKIIKLISYVNTNSKIIVDYKYLPCYKWDQMSRCYKFYKNNNFDETHYIYNTKNNNWLSFHKEQITELKSYKFYSCPAIYNTAEIMRNCLNLEQYDKNDGDNNVVFFGLYKERDINVLFGIKKKIILIFGGTDTLQTRNYTKKNFISLKKKKCKNIKYISISNYIYNDLKLRDIDSIPFYLSFTNTSLFNPCVKGNKIFIYDVPNEYVYHTQLIDEIIKLYGENKFIRVSKFKVPYEEMPKNYSQCFIGLRLTKHDGNSNSVQELGLMGIKCVHNSHFYNSISFNNLDDIIQAIENEKKKINTIDNLTSKICKNNTINCDPCDLIYDNNVNFEVTIIVYSYNDNCDQFCNSIKSVLFQHMVKSTVIIVTFENDICCQYIEKYYKDYCNLQLITVPKINIHDDCRKYYLINKGLKNIKTDWFFIISTNEISYSYKSIKEIKKLIKYNKNICVSNYNIINNNNLDNSNIINLDANNIHISSMMNKKILEFYLREGFDYQNLKDSCVYLMFKSILIYNEEYFIKENTETFVSKKILLNTNSVNVKQKKPKLYYILGNCTSILLDAPRGDIVNELNQIYYLLKYCDVYYNNTLINLNNIHAIEFSKEIVIPDDKYDIYYIRNNKIIYDAIKNYNKPIIWFATPYYEDIYKTNIISFLTKSWYDLYESQYDMWGNTYPINKIQNINKILFNQRVGFFKKNIGIIDKNKLNLFKNKIKNKFVIAHFGSIRDSCHPHHFFNICDGLSENIKKKFLLVFFTVNVSKIKKILNDINIKINAKNILIFSVNYAEIMNYYELCDLILYNQLDCQSDFAGSLKILEAILYKKPILINRSIQRELELGSSYELFYNIKKLEPCNNLKIKIINYEYTEKEKEEIVLIRNKLEKMILNKNYYNKIVKYISNISLKNNYIFGWNLDHIKFFNELYHHNK